MWLTTATQTHQFTDSNQSADIVCDSFAFSLSKTATLGSVATLFRWSWKILSNFVANLSKTVQDTKQLVTSDFILVL